MSKKNRTNPAAPAASDPRAVSVQKALARLRQPIEYPHPTHVQREAQQTGKRVAAYAPERMLSSFMDLSRLSPLDDRIGFVEELIRALDLSKDDHDQVWDSIMAYVSDTRDRAFYAGLYTGLNLGGAK